MKRWPAGTMRIVIPSSEGYEKTVAAAVRVFAVGTGLSETRAEDLGTAVSEACLNAIEHGNRGLADAAVVVTVTHHRNELLVEVRDCGRSRLEPDVALTRPDLAERVAGRVPPRGWGIYLMRQLVDAVEFVAAPRHNLTRLTVYLSSRKEREHD